MPLRMIARELYRLQKEVEALEAQLGNPTTADRDAVEDKLRKARAERDRMRGALEGNKEPPSCRRPR